ncbi:Phosphatidylserine/phosphatidylglycerophosphate/cardiolinpin synthase -like protein [Brachionus plicatilis]|uniref:Phosphatidylserine/phosphatidylglycerophosphate/ cardiolinpin synthase-like protein n=1 Tax=Brachionus plicatilis TaxID=10195 RepID=A0A3M7P8P6_BRAPC|nr:Phosphatidylserine/phosphatidylglycerophosphate/cardiolinpin synthase -like protein [Brachionus plicatilis]
MKFQPRNSSANLLKRPAVLEYIANTLIASPSSLQEIFSFLSQNGVNLQELVAGNFSSLNGLNLVDRLTAFIQSRPQLKELVVKILNHFGIQLPRIDWSSIGQAIIDAVPTIIQHVPTVISVISLFGKRDASRDLLNNLVTLASQYNIDLSVIESAIQAIQSGNFSQLLNLVLSNINLPDILAGLDVQSLLGNLDLSQLLPLVQNRKF